MPRKATDLAGKRFGDWEAIERDGVIGANAAWLCRCPHGHTRRISALHLTSGRATRCGCDHCTERRKQAAYAADEDFVRAWQSSKSIEEVAKKLSLTATKVRSIRQRMAKYKVPLKKYESGTRPGLRAHYDRLRKLAEDS